MKTAQKNRLTMLLLLAVVGGVMFFVGFVLVPMYQVICKATGINDLGGADKIANSQIDQSRLVTIEFDANTNHLPWQFRPLQNSMKVHPGQLSQAYFEVHNDRGYPVSGQAIASYGPSLAAQYFKKIQCFCFTRQTLAGNEVRRMPVVFLVDGKLPKGVNTITLSYTFFEVESGQPGAATAPRPTGA